MFKDNLKFIVDTIKETFFPLLCPLAALLYMLGFAWGVTIYIAYLACYLIIGLKEVDE